eukprot:UN26778
MTQYETMLNRHLQEILKLGEDTYGLSYTDTVAISQWWFTQKLNESNAKTAVVGKNGKSGSSDASRSRRGSDPEIIPTITRAKSYHSTPRKRVTPPAPDGTKPPMHSTRRRDRPLIPPKQPAVTNNLPKIHRRRSANN